MENCYNIQINSEIYRDNQKFSFYSTQTNVANSGRTIGDGTYLISGNGFILVNKGNQIGGNVNKSEALVQYFYISYDDLKESYLIESCSTEKMIEANKGSIVPDTPVVLTSKNSSSKQ